MSYKKLVLIQPPHEDRESHLFPLGIGYIGMAALKEGVEFEVFDIHAHKLKENEVIKKIEKFDCDLVGINAFSTQYKYFKWLVEIIRNTLPNALIVGGGPLTTFNARLVLEKTSTDICVICEGDVTIKEIINSNKNDFNNIPGIAYKDEGKIVFTASRELIREIDKISFINYEMFPLDIYFNSIGLFGFPTKRAINIITSRGCPYNCNFCSRTIPGTRLRSMKNISTELKKLKNRFGIDGVIFNDELAIISKKRTLELCSIMKELNLKWGCQGRANLVSVELLKEMKKSGCVYLGLGIESGSQRILDNMNKNITAEQNEKAIRNVLKTGIIPVVQMIYGYPGEDETTINETIKMFDRLHYMPPTVFAPPYLNLITPLPGSKLYDDCLTNGKIKDEEKYLMKLGKGYYANAPLLVNLTQFNDEELLNQKQKMEQKIHSNYKKYLKQNILKYLLSRFALIKNKLTHDLKKLGALFALKNSFMVLIKKVKVKF